MSNIPAGKYAPKPRSTGNPSAPLLGPSTGAGRPRKPPTVALVAEHYLAAGVDHSLGHYARYWRDNFGEMALDELSPTWFRAWRREALERWAAATCRQAENALSGLFRVASEAGWKLTNPVRVCGLSQPRNCRYKALTAEETERLLAACKGDLRDVVAFALQTGLRIGELLSIEWEHWLGFEQMEAAVELLERPGVPAAPAEPELLSLVAQLSRQVAELTARLGA